MRAVPALVLAFACVCPAASPDFGAIYPRGGQRGTSVPVTLGGARLDDAEEIVSYSADIKVADLKVESATALKATFQIGAGCPFGEHTFRVRTKSGVSYGRTFWVGPFPTVDEVEPNDKFTSAQSVTYGSTLAGIAKNEDADYFKIEGKKGDRLNVEVEGIRLGSSFWDPYVAILDSKKFELATCDDSALLVQDPHASIIIPEDGTYYIEIRDSSYAGNDVAFYRAHVGRFPRPTAVYPNGGKAGSKTEVTFLNDPAGPVKQTVEVPNTPGEKLPLYAVTDLGSAPSPNLFRISDLENVLETEPNDSLAEAKAQPSAPPAVPIAFNGIIGKPNDSDWFRFTAKKDQRLDLAIYSRSLRSPLDPVLEIFNADGGGLNGNDDNGPNPDSRIGGFTFPADGDYYIRVHDQLNRGGPDFVYRVEAAPPAPSMNAYITRFDRVDSQMRQQMPVPRGGRYATLINVDRANWGGPVAWDAPNLPPGVTLESDPMPNGIGQYAVVFAAAADAPRGLALTRLMPKSTEEKNPSAGRFSQNLELVQGEPNQTPYVICSQTTLPVAVTDEVPFSLEIIKPTVPLVQSGTIDLKVHATRKEGFTAPITVRLLWNPPGITSPGTIDIPAGKSDGIYQLTARGDAPAQAWKVTMLGETDAGAGPIYNATPFTEVTVAPPYLTMKMEMGAAEQGKPGEIFCTLEVAKTWTGPAKVTLYGLPAKVTTVEKEISATDKEVRFPITTVADSPVGKHQSLFCQAVIIENGVPIPHTIGQGGVLRIDAPPPAPAVPAPEAAVAQAAPPPPPPSAKPLSRLEQLRQQQAAAAKP
ncbi:MAG: peptidase [Verrucomicrobiales bacterium]|nr:peptidase [Verrucomicrobiales bacterium]